MFIGRYSGSSESKIDEDIKQINEKGVAEYLQQMEQNNLGDGFWEFSLLSDLETSSVNNNAYNLYLAAQCINNTPAFLSKTMNISSLIEQRGDVHHIFPRKYLANNSYAPKIYNQVANFVYTEQATNIKVGMLAPIEYIKNVKEEIDNKVNNISTIDTIPLLNENLKQNDIPTNLEELTHENYTDFLKERRKLMAKKLRAYYNNL